MEVIRLSHYDVDYVFTPPRLSRGFTERDYFIKTHTQRFYEINIVLKGTGVHFFGEQSIKVGVGDTFIVPPNAPHSYEGGQGFDVYHLLLHPKYLEKNSASLSALPTFSSLFRVDPLLREKNAGDLHLKLSEAEIKSLSPHLNNLVSLENKADAVTAIVSDSVAMIIIATLCSLYEQKTPNAPDVSEDKSFASSLAYIYEHFSEVITVDTLCRIAKMSRTAYLTKFKRVTGTTPTALQNAHRIEIAKSLLLETSAPVSEISANIGCYDTSHFIRLFKKETGLTPSRYRKNDGKKD